MSYKYIVVALLFLFSSSIYSQNRSIKSSNKDYSDLAYVDAQKMYLKIVEKGYADMELYQKLADTYYYNNDYVSANKWYSKVFEYDTYSIGKEYYFKYIQTLKSVKDYDKSEEIIDEYIKVKGEDQFIKNYLSNRDYMNSIDLQSSRYEIKSLSLNSSSQDFGVGLYDNGKRAVFASSKDSSSLVKNIHKWSNREFLNLYSADVDQQTGELINIEQLSKKINSKFHESNAVFSKDNKTAYFTRNNYFKSRFKTSSDDINKLKIYRVTRDSIGDNWGNLEELSINGEEFSTAHPALSAQEDKLYFASDRPGGKKGLFSEKSSSDIWYVTIDSSGNLGTPVNVEHVNTPGNELFPFVSSKGDLYFSSTGHQGLGGLDVYVSQNNNGSLEEEVINLGRPLNGPQDDFAFVINEQTKKGYISSNRLSGKGLDDIYSFVQTGDLKEPKCEVELAGVVTDSKTGALIPFSTVVLLDSNNKEVEKVVVGQDAAYNFVLECSQNYSIKAIKDDYAVGEAFVQTPDKRATTNSSLAVDSGSGAIGTSARNVIKQPLEVSRSIESRTKEAGLGDDIGPALGIKNIYFDYDKSNIRYDAEIELQKIITYMNAYPNSAIDIRSHTDSRAADGYNIKLSDRRAKSTRAYLISKGIAPHRLTASGYGEYQLVNECSNGVKCSEEQHQLNRRSEFILTRR